MGDRWLGKRHAYKVKKNPLHYTEKIEHTIECIRCQERKHYSSFQVGPTYARVCSECREILTLRHR